MFWSQDISQNIVNIYMRVHGLVCIFVWFKLGMHNIGFLPTSDISKLILAGTDINTYILFSL